jgi:uncharacterized membrane protein YheB (UPF0754 family)
VNSQELIALTSIPLFTGVMGYITNWTGVIMLFRPLTFHGIRVPGLHALFAYLPRRVRILPLISYTGAIGWQGIVPSRADKMASIAVDKGLGKLGSMADFYRELEPEKIAEHLTVVAQKEIRGAVEQIMLEENPQLWRDLPPVIKEAVHARVRQQLPDVVREITNEIGTNIDQVLDAKLMVIRYFSRHPEFLNELFLVMGSKELRFMKNFGLYFGIPMGFLLFAILQVAPYWWVLPVGGIIVGWVVNWLGVTMIFWPVVPKRWVPWRQGLLVKRQDEVTEGYARIVADHVITLQNVGHELLYGTRSDRTLQLLEDSLRPAVDRAIGPARALVKAAIGTGEYNQIRDSIANEVAQFAPAAFADVEFNKRQSQRIYTFVVTRMRMMSSEDFVEMLRAAIRQDEWLLFVHGAALGLIAGLLHLAIFGT